ncbi:MAG: hypothetical protein RLZZ269_1429 [Actinomycetota bacterium]|jgi:hypothetical protein
MARSRLTIGWARTVAAGWALMAICLACVGASSQIIGRPTWWADDERWSAVIVSIFVLVVFGAATAIAVWSFFRRPFTPFVSTTGALLLGASSLADVDSSPGSAVVTGALAVAALLLSIGSFSGIEPSRSAAGD